MTIEKAVRKLEKAGFRISNNGRFYFAIKNEEIIDFHDQDGKVYGIRQRGINDHDDVQSDYFAGVYCDNISQAIRISGV